MKILAIATILLCALTVLFVLDEIDLRGKLSDAYKNVEFLGPRNEELSKSVRTLSIENAHLKEYRDSLYRELRKCDPEKWKWTE